MPLTKQQVLDAFYFRHAAKTFDPDKKISPDDFDLILEAARLSPSSFGLEPWNIIVLQNMELREKLKPYSWGARGQLPTASHFVLITAKTRRALHPDGEYIAHMKHDIHQAEPERAARSIRRIENFFNDDFKIDEPERAIWDWAGKQAYIALANMMTAAALIGIDSCPIEGFQADPVENILREEGVVDGQENRLVVMAAFGFRAKEPEEPKTRRPMSEIVQWVRS